MGGIFLQITQPGDDGRFEVLFFCDEGPADAVVFDVVPDEFIGVELGAVRRQEEEPQFARECLEKLLNPFGPMGGMPVDDEKDFPAVAMEQTLEELHKEIGPHRLFGHHESEIPFRGDGGNHVEPEPLACGTYHWCLPLHSPGRSGMKVRTHSGLILEEDLGPFLLGLGVDPGVFLLEPLLDQRGILLQGFDDRFLTGQAQLGQEASDRRQGQTYPVLFPNQRPDHGSGPQGEWEFQLKRILGGDGLINPSNLTGGKLLGSARHLARLEGVPTSGPVRSQPLVDTTPGESQGFDHSLGAFPVPNLLDGADSDGLTGFVVDATTIAALEDGLCGVHAIPYQNPKNMYSTL